MLTDLLAALKLDHWRCYQDAQKVVWAILDRKGASANTLSEPVFREFETLLGVVEKMQPSALVFRSAKKSGFKVCFADGHHMSCVEINRFVFRQYQ